MTSVPPTRGRSAPTPEAVSPLVLSGAKMLLVYLASPLAITYMSFTGLLIPLRLLELDASPLMVGLFVGAGGLLATALAVPAGAIGERMGPRRAFMVGGVLNALAAAAFAILDNYWALLAVQIARGGPHSLGWVAGQTYVMGIGRPEDRAAIAGRFGATSSLLGFIGPLISGTIAQVVGFQAAFWFVAVYCVFFVALASTLPELKTNKNAVSDGSIGFGAALELLRLRTVKVALLLTFVRLWIGAGWQPFYIIFLQQEGFGPAFIGSVNAVNALAASATGLRVSAMLRFGSKELITAVGLGLGGLGILISPHLAAIPWVYLPSLLMGVGGGVSLPLVMAMLAEEAGAGQRGVAMGLRTMSNQAGGMIAPAATGLILGPTGMVAGFALNALLVWAMLGTAMVMHMTVRSEASSKSTSHL